MDTKTIDQLETALKRIFAMPMTKSTFRQLQHAIVTITNGDRELSNSVLEAIVTGQLKNGNADLNKGFKKLSENFAWNVVVSKEIFERGEFLSLLTSDIIAVSKDNILLNNIIRRIDGEEFQLITDVGGSFNIVQHFISRLEEVMNKTDNKELQDQIREVFVKIHEQLGNWLHSTAHK